MTKEETNLIKIQDYLREHGLEDHNDFTPILLIIQRHLENIEATYGTQALQDIIRIMGLSDSAPVKRKKEVKAS